MSTLAADVAFGFTFPSCEPAAPDFSFDSSLLQLPYNPGHARSSSRGSVYSVVSSAASTADSLSTRMTTPPRASPPVRHHGPILLPKIRSQDQAIGSAGPAAGPAAPAKKRIRKSASPCPARKPAAAAVRKSHARSFTNPETLNFAVPFVPQQQQQQQQTPQPEEHHQFEDHRFEGHTRSQSLLCSPATFTTPNGTPTPEPPVRSASCGVDDGLIGRYGFPTYRQMPTYLPATTTSQASSQSDSGYTMYSASGPADYAPRSASPLSYSPEPTPTTTLLSYLAAANPAPSLVRTISYHHRDPNARHFWWDVRQVRPWTTFNSTTVLSLPGATTLLTCPVALPLLPTPAAPSTRHPETEAALHAIYAQHYLPKLNAALAVSSTRPLHLSVAPKPASASASSDLVFVANGPGESASAAAIFGGKPTARVVGLVRSFDRFNTGMRVEGNVKRVEYLRGLAALHHVMREHSCRYGFILTEIELVIVRNGTEATPHFGHMEVTSIQLAGRDSGADFDLEAMMDGEAEMPACLALWGLCMLASDDVHTMAPGAYPTWKSDIGAPAEGTRRKAMPRDDWMPKPQLAEKREAKRARGWVMPEDAVGRKELGKRGVRYSAC
ncbi:related to sialidase [Cephalotrichum gorgonifer]|uniref:Related to sialidase n=1 Tax=Cephalotrichum gorgonifer TaxID=2041049 RepID=A0AAE8N2Y4_9PEZI|nr:related to sialidase [Cephalotrichum gorgonifer]